MADSESEIREIFQKCYNGVVQLPEQLPSGGFVGLNMKLFADIWGDERMSFRDKRLVVLGLLAGKAAPASLFTIHARSALKNGELTAEELRMLVNIVLFYGGTPDASTLYMALEQLIAEVEGGAKQEG